MYYDDVWNMLLQLSGILCAKQYGIVVHTLRHHGAKCASGYSV
jgi:hypothetical protein